MTIVFLGFTSSYTDGMAYQDNILCELCQKLGHRVIYLSNPEKFKNGQTIYVGPEDCILENGIRLIRLPYHNYGFNVLTKKIRGFDGVYEMLEKLSPDVIFCHGTQYMPVLDVVKYKKNHPEVKVYADTHASAANSGRNWLSLNVLHRIYYKYLLKKILPYLEKFFYIGYEEKKFAVQNYKVPQEKMEFFPLGGTYFENEVYFQKRDQYRKIVGIKDDELLLLHTGKFDKLKRTKELVRAFSKVRDLKAKLILIGSFEEHLYEEIEPLLEKDNRVSFIGWKSAEELLGYLCACDLYCQPGSVSATMQNAICCRCPILVYPHESYKKDFDFNNMIWIKSEEDMRLAFEGIRDGAYDLSELSDYANNVGRDVLDYSILIKKFLVDPFDKCESI